MNEKNGFPAWNNNPGVFEINRLPARTIFTGFSRPEDALGAALSVPGADGHVLPARVRASERYLSLNGKWSFHLADRPSERPANFFENGYDASGWAKISVPAHWQLEGFDYPQYTNIRYPWENSEPLAAPFAPEKYNPVGSYLRTFSVPGEWKDMQTVISFQGVESAFYVWLNGEFVGYSEDSFTPAEFDLTPFLKPGDNNLAVEVYRWCDASWLEDQDFWRLSGIFRDVFLFARPPVHLRDYRVRSSVEAGTNTGRMELSVEVGTLAKASENFSIDVTLFDPEGKELSRTSAKVASAVACASGGAAGSTGVAASTAKISPEAERAVAPGALIGMDVVSVRPWSAEIPALYTVLVVLRDERGVAVDSTAFRTGFRSFAIRNGIMELNGKRIVFYGVNRHEFNAVTGRCVGAADMIGDAFEMKRNNVNAVRTSHYPNSLLWYDLCDYYGLYMIDETNIETHGTWQFGTLERGDTALPGDLSEWTECVLDRARSMYLRDRNHASILIWSLGNESWGGTNHEKMHDFFREVDPDRVVHYEGVFHYRKAERASDVESQMYTPASGLAEYADGYDQAKARGETRKPFILCEYSHAMGNSCGGLHLYTDLFKTRECLQGGFVWDWIDQALWTRTSSGIRYLAYGGDFGDVPNDGNFSGNGLLFADRTPTPKLAEVRACYSQFDFSLDDKAGCVVRIGDRTLFSGFSGLSLSWKLLADGTVVAKGQGLPVSGVPESGGLWTCNGASEARDAALLSGKTRGRELVLEAALVRETDMPWAAAGEPVASAQWILESPSVSAPSTQGSTLPKVENLPGGGFAIHAGNDLAGGAALEAEFTARGQLRSLSRGDTSYSFAGFRPDFWRAMTDNDRGNAFIERLGLWKLASYWIALLPAKIEVASGADRVTVTVSWALPPILAARCELVWEFFSGGRVRLTERLVPGKGRYLPEIPFVGIEAIFEKPVESFEWYGYGPHENYMDRRHGAALGLYSSTPAASFVPYLKPQECGNRTGVRSLAIASGGESSKLDFRNCVSGDRPVYGIEGSFEFSLLPWTRDELDKARHAYELSMSRKSVLRIGMAQMGVGGDNSWGAPTLPAYTLSAEADYEWSVDIVLE